MSSIGERSVGSARYSARVSSPWSLEQVQALAPDPASFIAARRVARAVAEAGTDGPVIWGLCQGSGKTPYKTCAEVERQLFKCSCPSRKSPCKHALGLLLAWAEGAFPAGSAPEWAVFPEKKAPVSRTPSAKAVAARQERVAGGVIELRQWLRDQVRHGIAGLDQAGYRHFELMAARLVDAQAPGLASAVRSLASVPSTGEGWEGRLLGQLSLLHLLAGASSMIDDLPPDLADIVRVRVGQSVPTEQVLAGPPVRDAWQVIGIRDSYEERLTVRRVWLIGRETGREALVLSFAAPGQSLPADLIGGTEIDADLCFYPGIRALVAATDGVSLLRPEGRTVAESLRRLTGALAEDPWLEAWPMLLHGSVVPGEPWHIVDPDGEALPLDPRCGDQWRFLAASGGGPAVIAAEWTWAGLIPLAMYVDDDMVLA